MPDQATVRRALRALPSSSWCRKPSPPPPPATTPTCCCPPPPGARRTAPSPTASAASAACAPAVPAPGEARARLVDRGRLRAPAGGAPAARRAHDGSSRYSPGRRRRRGDLERAPRIDARPRPRHHRPELRACWKPAPQQWPLPEGAADGPRAALRRRRLPDRRRPRALRRHAVYKPVAEPRDARYPFSLNTGRLRDQWHGMSRTGTLGRLFGHVRRAGACRCTRRTWRGASCRTATWCRSRSRRGAIVLPVQASDRGRPEPGLHRDALGRGIPERPRRRRHARWPASTR